jgi:glycosyltransferase involved in cell wall biosynthesis
MEQTQQKLCLVTFFNHEAFFIPLSHIRKIIIEISPQSKSIITVSPDLEDKMIFDVKKDDVIIYKTQINPLFRILNYFILNLKISWSILLISKDVDSFLFFMETGFPLPMTIVKLRNKRIIWLLPSSSKKMIGYHHDFPKIIFTPMQSVSYYLADKIVLYSPNLVNEWDLGKYRNKIIIAHEHFLNTKTFTVTRPISDRPQLIGYIGRLSEEKGIQNFVLALPQILKNQKNLRVIIGGDGGLKESIKTSLVAEKLTDRVDLPGWISHDDLPQYLNQFQLLVLPSYTEGLPNIVLEALSCGTPVLATPVGAISDIIKDGETGFIMRNNSPECIAENIIRALNFPNLGKITENGRWFVEENFTFERTKENWKNLIKNL